MKKIRSAILGMGFIGVSHMEAIRRIGCAELAAVADTNYQLAQSKADEYNIPKCYETIDALLEDKDIDVIHNCTPNFLHTEINKKIIKAGKHVFSEKPLAMNHQESEELLTLLAANPHIVHGVNFCYRMNPLTLEMKQMVRGGDIGKPMLVHGSYLQDWLLFDTDYNWRVEPEISGPSRCVGDIGSHWMDLAQNVLGARITDVSADLVIAHPVRKKAKGVVETFARNTSLEYEEKEVKTEDYAAVMFKMDNGVHGVFHVSEISAGRKCWLNIEVDGAKSSLYWNQETSDRMWIGHRDEYNRHVMRNPLLMHPEAAQYTYLAAGHPEGWNDAMKNTVQSYYNFILSGKSVSEAETDFATFADGHYITRLTEAILLSSLEKRWVNIDEV